MLPAINTFRLIADTFHRSRKINLRLSADKKNRENTVILIAYVG
jgi:hypothetical protein